MSNRFLFEVGQVVYVKDLKCVVLERELGTDDWYVNDYLCKPLDESKMILGQWELGPGWVYENNIKPIETSEASK